MMNKQELHEAFSTIHASDALKKQVISVEMENKKTVNGWKIARRAVACAAVFALLLTIYFWPGEVSTEDGQIIEASGLLTVKAHAVDEEGNATVESVVLEEGIVFTPEYIYRTDTSYREKFSLLFQLEHEHYNPEEIMLGVNTNAGIFYKYTPGDLSMIGKSPVEQLLYHYHGQHFTVSADEKLYWQPEGFDYTYMKEQYEKGNTSILQIYKLVGFSANPSFFDVIIRVDDNIIGYCVIEVTMSPTEISPYAHRFSFEVVTLISFPMVDGRHQNVSYKYVLTQIQQIHSEREKTIDG